MNLEHSERRRWVEEISSINQQMNVADAESI
jgi:triosephosphate isomerase